jgi:hypothetical protein
MVMPDREKVIRELRDIDMFIAERLGHEKAKNFLQTIDETIILLKEKKLPTELKLKMWNALYTEEDEYEKKFVGKEEHLNWFTVYRPWLQKGFDIAINAIADWEGR